MARPRRVVLTSERVIDAAISMIGEGGLEAFSMPKLATLLGVRAPSLYHYFDGRDALLAAVARTVATPEPPPPPAPDADPIDYLVSASVSMYRSIVAHPHCAPLLVRYMPKANMFDEYEQMCQYLGAAGVPVHAHVRIVDGLTALTMGAALLNENAAHYTTGGAYPADPQTHPALCAALEFVGDATPDEQFEVYLRDHLNSVLKAGCDEAGRHRRPAADR